MLGLPGADTRDRAVVDQAGVTPPLQVVLGDHYDILRNGWQATSRSRPRPCGQEACALVPIVRKSMELDASTILTRIICPEQWPPATNEEDRHDAVSRIQCGSDRRWLGCRGLRATAGRRRCASDLH